MHSTNSKYVSVFKIDGIPILAPVITDTVREQIRIYRQKAMAIEQKLLQSKSVTLPLVSHRKENKLEETFQQNEEKSEYQQLSNNNDDYSSEFDDESAINKKDSSDSEINTEISETESIADNTKTEENYSFHIDQQTLNSNIEVLNIVDETKNYTPDAPSTPPPPPPSDEDCPRLIRSNSYTLETPSPLFLKHLQEKSSSDKQINKNIALNIEPIKLAAKPKRKMLPTKSAYQPASVVKYRKLSYDNVVAKEKPQSKNISNLNKSQINKPTNDTKVMPANLLKLKNIYNPKSKSANRPQKTATTKENVELTPKMSVVDFLAKLDEEHKNQMHILMERQTAEQNQMHENFLKQQQLLIKQISENFEKTITIDKSPKQNLISSPKSSPPTDKSIASNAHFNLDQYMHRARQQIKENIAISILENTQNDVEEKQHFPAIVSTPHQLLKSDDIEKEQQAKKISAAITINAYARGYLVRRLFNTELVQNIIKIIRDTLLFIIDLHAQDAATETLADIKLKKSLLQQLNSACIELHEIFFIKTTVERMEIISADRNIIKIKLNNLRDRQRKSINTTTFSINRTREHSLNKLEKVAIL